MRNQITDVTIYDEPALPQSTFTVVAATDVFTSGAAHGFSLGDKLQFTTATTLPAGLATSTNYYVISIPSTTTFKVSTSVGGASVNVTDTGTGTHTYHLKGRMVYVGDFTNVHIALNFTDTPTMTVKFQGTSQMEDADTSLAQSATNRWDYVDVNDLEDGSSIDGDVGVSCAGTADNRMFSANVEGLQYISADVTSWTAGSVGILVTAYEH